MLPAFSTPSNLAAELDQLRLDHALPGLVWAAAPLDGPLIAGASGVRRLGQPEAMTVLDRVHLGSCTKPVVATMLASLVSETLDWTTRLTSVFPAGELHEAYHEVTLAHLLSHCAGLAAFDEDTDFRPAPPRRGSAARQRLAFVRWILRQPPARPAGEYGYSNAGYSVAAVMAEQLTTAPWEELMRARVFEPLGLHSAGFGWPGRHHEQEPWGHLWRRGRQVPHPPRGRYQLHAAIGPAGDLHMNILDFAAFARTHLRGLCGQADFLNPETLSALHTPFRPDIKAGLGWGVTTYRGMRASTHSGSADTFLAFIVVLPDEGHAFVVVTNAAGGQAEEGLASILRHLVGAFTTAHVH